MHGGIIAMATSGGVTAWLGIAGGVISIVVFLGAVTVYLRGSRDKGTIETLTKNNAALSERVRVLEDSEKRLETRLGVVERENAALKLQRPSAEAIEGLLLRVIQHDTETKAMLEEIKVEVTR